MWLDTLNEKIQKNPLFILVILISTTLTFLATIIGNITAIESFVQKNRVLSLIFIIGTILILLVIFGSTAYFNKREILRKVEWLKPGANIGVYLGKFGDPMVINHYEDKNIKEYVFIHNYFYLVLITDMNDEVHCFAITIKNKAFKPTFKSPGYPKSRPSYKIKLGVSTFSKIPGDPEHISSYLMAHYGHSYYETFYFGRPGYYLHYAFGINDTGYEPKDLPRWRSVFSTRYDTDSIPEELEVFRSTATFNTYAVSNDSMSFRDIFPGSLGASYEQVRRLEDK